MLVGRTKSTNCRSCYYMPML